MTVKNADSKTNKIIEDAWLNLPSSYNEDSAFNPLLNIPENTKEEPHLYIIWLLSNPEYFAFFTKYILNIDLSPMQLAIVHELWYRKFPMLIASRGFSKTYLLALYTLLRLLFLPNRKVVVTGAAFRQSKFVFEYLCTIWNNAPVLRSLCSGADQGPFKEVDLYRFRIFNSSAVFLPLGDGSRIRGLRAHDILGDEFSSIPRDIFETVISGFALVSSNPIQNMKDAASKKVAKSLNLWTDNIDEFKLDSIPNQIILSGTAYYDFNHFAEYWKRYHKIIEANDNQDKMAAALGGPDKYDPALSSKHFSIIRIPYDLIPEGFMDAAQIARSRATFDTSIFNMELRCVFSKDSNGFFKRTLIESCSLSNESDFGKFPSGVKMFEAQLQGYQNREYVYGIDPASEHDNLAITILEVHSNHRRIVYCWTTNKKEFKRRLENGVVLETDYYTYVARKIRELMLRFPTTNIAIDSQGGGYAVLEALHNKNNINHELGELPVWPKINYNKPNLDDAQAGLHIVEMVNFASADWTRDANHGLKADFESKVILFPFYDSISLGQSELVDNERIDGIKYDSLEDCIMNIEELKDELSMIVLTQTPSGREHFDTPEVKISGSKKGRVRKDRYSALLMANMLARTVKPSVNIELSEGGFAGGYKKMNSEDGPDYVGPSWFTEKMKNVY